MTRLLASAALGIGLMATFTPATTATACEFSQCAWGQIACSVINCPLVCYRVPELGRTVCLFR